MLNNINNTIIRCDKISISDNEWRSIEIIKAVYTIIIILDTVVEYLRRHNEESRNVDVKENDKNTLDRKKIKWKSFRRNWRTKKKKI